VTLASYQPQPAMGGLWPHLLTQLAHGPIGPQPPCDPREAQPLAAPPLEVERKGTDVAQVSSRKLWSTTPLWYTYLVQRLADLALPDSECVRVAIPRSVISRAIDEAVRLFDETTPTPSVVPADDEVGVSFVWHKRGWDIEIDVMTSGSFALWQDQQSSVLWYESLDSARESVARLLASLSDR